MNCFVFLNMRTVQMYVPPLQVLCGTNFSDEKGDNIDSTYDNQP